MTDVFDRFGIEPAPGDVFDRVLSGASKAQREAYARTAREEAGRLRQEQARRDEAERRERTTRTAPPASRGTGLGRFTGGSVVDDLVGTSPASRIDEAVRTGGSYGPTGPEPVDSWTDTARKGFERVVPNLKRAIGGTIQAAIESGGELPANYPLTSAEREQMRRDHRAAVENLRAEGNLPGQQLAARAGEELAASAYNPGDSTAKRVAGIIADTLPTFAAGIAGGAVTRNPTVGATIMTAPVYGQQYADSRDKGRSAEQANMDATFMALTEMIGERIPVGTILGDGGKSVMRRALKAAGQEGAQEFLTQGLQTAYEAGVIGEKMTLREAAQSMIDAGLAGAVLGGGASLSVDAARGGRDLIAKRPIAPGIREQAEVAAATPTQEDIDSPLPTQLITAGRAEIARGEATGGADSILRAAGYPAVGTKVSVNLPGGATLTGSVADAFETVDDAGPSQGIKIALDDGTLFEHHFDELTDAGVTVAPAAVEAPPVVIAEPSPRPAPAPRPARPSVEAMVDAVMPRIRGAESSGNDGARNSRSSAAGRYQFIDSTWLATYRAEFGKTGETDAQILAKKGDGALQDRLMRRLTTQNAASLERAGVAVDPGSLYLAHFAGARGAIAMAQADPNASVESVLGAGVVRANPFLEGKTVGETRVWAAAKVGASTAGSGADVLEAPAISLAAEPIAFEDVDFGPEPAPLAPPALPAPDTAVEPIAAAPTDVRGEPIDSEWRRFTPESGTLDIPRDQMPQIKAENRGAMVNFLAARGITHAEDTVAADSLKPTQSEFSEAKVEKAKAFEGGNRAILVSADGHVVDGHHQWLAARDTGEDIRVIRLGAPIADVIETVREMPSAETSSGASPSTIPEPQISADAAIGGGIASTTPPTPIPVRVEGRTDTAVTGAGREVPVRYAVVEAADLIASNDAEGNPNPRYPAALQPRDRSRGVSQTQIVDIAANLNPRLLGESPKASDGAPIISPEGVVESGNGRTLALQRAYAAGGSQAEAYRTFLAEQGYDVGAMAQPVLVRIRDGAMPAADVEAFKREANARDTLSYSSTEQAMSDAAALSDDVLGLYRGGDIDMAGNREFVRAFIRSGVAKTDQASMIAADGSMSQTAIGRIRGALLARAYGNAGVVAQATESTDSDIKTITGAMTDVAGTWAQMTSAARAGSIDPQVDITDALNEAVGIVDRARREGRPVADLVGQTDMFGGGIASQTEGVLCLFFARPDFTRPVSRKRLGEALSFYAGEAMKTAPGGGLFGEETKASPDAIVGLARDRINVQGPEQADFLTAPAAAERPIAEPAVSDAPPNGDVVDRPGRTVVPQARSEQANEPVTAEPSERVPEDADPVSTSTDDVEGVNDVASTLPAEPTDTTHDRLYDDETDEQIGWVNRASGEVTRLFTPEQQAALDRVAPHIANVRQYRVQGPDGRIFATVNDVEAARREALRAADRLGAFDGQFAAITRYQGRRDASFGPITIGYGHPASLDRRLGPRFRVLGPVSRLTGDEMGVIPTDVLARIPFMRDRAIEHYRDNLQGQEVVGEDGIPVIISKKGARKAANAKGEDLLSAVPAIPQIIAGGAIKELGPSPKNPRLRAFLYSADVDLLGEVRRLAVIVREDANGRRTYDLTFDNGADAVEAEHLSVTPGRYNLFVAADPDLSVWSDQAPPRDLAPVQQQLEQRLAQLGLADKMRVQAVDRLFNDPSIAGSYWRGLAQVALDAGTDAQTTLDHEAVHALRDLGLITPAEWSVLAAAARADSAAMASVDERYPGLDAEARVEEAVADRFAAWAAGQRQERGAIARAFARIHEVLRAIGQALRGGGFNTAESVMRAIEGGAVGARETDGAAGSEPKQSREAAGPAPRVAGTLADARAVARERIVGRNLVNEATGLVAKVSNGTLLKMTSNKAVAKSTTIDDHIAAVVNVDALFAAAEEDGSHPDRRGEPTIKAIRRFAAPMDGVNGPVSVKMTVKETTGANEPNPLYTVEALAIEMVEPGSVSETSAPEVSPNAAPPGSEADVGLDGADSNGPKFSRTTAPGLPGIIGDGAASARRPHQPTLDLTGGATNPPATTLSGATGGFPTGNALATAVDRWRTRLQDRMLPLLRTQQAAERVLGRRLDEAENPYIGEELMTGRVGAQLEQLADTMVEPLFDAMNAEGVTIDELETYLYARHAPERNARIASINPEFGPGEGSGMTDVEAAAIMARIDRAGKTGAMERLAARVDAILQFSVDTRVEAGLMSAADAQAWRDTYQHYVPLRGQAEMAGDSVLPPPRGSRSSGISVTGKESRRAFGRRSKADDILAYSIMQAEEAIARAGTNHVAKQFLTLAQAAPDPDFWKVDKVTRRAVWNKAAGQVEYRAERRLDAADKDFTVTAKVDGVEHRVTLNRGNQAAVDLAVAMRNLTAQQTEWVVRTFGSVNRFLSAVNTSYNPEFVITNAFRDIQTAGVNLNQFDVPGLVRGVLKDYPKALAASVRGAFKADRGEWGRTYREFVGAGGRVYFNNVEDLDGIKKRIERSFALSSERAAGRLSVKRGFLATRDFIENANNGVENAIRLSAYKNARDAGMTTTQAASLAKNLTVNFNRRGSWGSGINAAYLFFNASVQGTAVMLTAMRSRRVQAILAGAVMTGAALEMLNAMLSGDDDDGEAYYDKISDFDKQRNLIVMIPGSAGDFIKIPLPYGYNAFFGMGRSFAEIARRGGEGWKESTVGMVTTFVDAFNPIGGAESLLNMLAPTVVDPIVDLQRNRDYADRPIMPEASQFGPVEPDAQRYFSSVAPYWKAITDTLTGLTGGDEVQPGAIDVSPETLEHLAGVVFGAAGSFIDRNVGALAKLMDPVSREELGTNDVPLARKVLGSKPSWYDKSAFYERLGQVEQNIAYAKDYIEREQVEGAERLVADNPVPFAMEAEAKLARKELRALRKERGEFELQHELGKIDDGTFEDARAAYRDAEAAIVARFNAAWNAASAEDER